MEPDQLLQALRESENSEDLRILRTLIGYASSPKSRENYLGSIGWNSILEYLLGVLAIDAEVGREKILLTSHAFVALLTTRCEFKERLKSYLLLETNRLFSLDREYHVRNVESFKLIVVHGYLQVNDSAIYSPDICSLSFDVLCEHCIRYTRYSYFAYKILQTWLRRTTKTNFWRVKKGSSIEQRLEVIVFSNWDNSIKEISQQNATGVFREYLKIMRDNYNGFLGFVFERCVRDISWQNETKYAMLREICEEWTDISSMTAPNFVSCLFTSLTRNYLRSSGSKLYKTISEKLGEDQWMEVFSGPVRNVVEEWESRSKKNYNALQLLCKQWLEPTINRFRNILPRLWALGKEVGAVLFCSHLARIAAKTTVALPTAPAYRYANHGDEFVRINGFAIYCHDIRGDDNGASFSAVKEFLFLNATAHTIYLRENIAKYFRDFLENVIRLYGSNEKLDRQILLTFGWLHEFFLDCFEVGACYQRKTMGVRLLATVLFYTSKSRANENLINDPRHKEALKCGFAFGERLKASGMWRFTDKQTLFVLLKLVLDPSNDIREGSANLILDHFHGSCLTCSEMKILLNTAFAKCNSSKFYEAESGALLFKVLVNWIPLHSPLGKEMSAELQSESNFANLYWSFVEILLREAESQLGRIKEDILKATVQGSPYYGILTAIEVIGFRDGPENHLVNEEFANRLLNLLEDTVAFFLSLLSSKSNDSEYSSSFAEMGLAIDEAVKYSDIDGTSEEIINLSPAHQLVVSCIWTSLKVSCEVASEIAALRHSYESVKRSADLVAAVLIKCRHKGAIESAGVAIGNIVRNLCVNDEYASLPEMYLQNLLRDNSGNNPNLTRRGAGLSIMFHRIVSGDVRRDRPLVHLATRNLLDYLENSIEEVSTAKAECVRDSSCVNRLHFLHALVINSELHAHLVCYLEEITLLCFRYLQSQVWTVRNASLQLLGAVVPRLVGQCIGGKSLDFGSGYSIDHFVTHYPAVANHVLTQLQSFSGSIGSVHASPTIHSNIVHILTLLSKLFTSGCDLIDYSSKVYAAEVRCNIQILFANPVGHIRILAAKAYAALVPFSLIALEYDDLSTKIDTIRGTNLKHGYLCAMKYLREKLNREMECTDRNYRISNFDRCEKTESDPGLQTGNVKGCHDEKELSKENCVTKFWYSLSNDARIERPCYVVETMLLELSRKPKAPRTALFLFDRESCDKMLVLSAEKTKPGFFDYVEMSMKLYADRVKFTNDIDERTVNRILNSACVDQSIAFFNHLSFHVPLLEIVLDFISNSLSTCDKALLEALICFLMRTAKQTSSSNVRHFKLREKVSVVLAKLKKKHDVHSKLEELVHLLSMIFSNDASFVNSAVSYVCARCCDPDENVRLLATSYMEYLLRRFVELDNERKLMVLASCVVLLKDEILEIRELTAEACRLNLMKNEGFESDSSRVVERIYYEILVGFASESRYVEFSENEVVKFIKSCAGSIKCSKNVAGVENPFGHDDDASYREEVKLLNVLFYSLNRFKSRFGKLDKKPDDCAVNENLDFSDYIDIIRAKNCIQNEAGLVLTDLQETLNLRYTDYLIAKKRIVMEACSS